MSILTNIVRPEVGVVYLQKRVDSNRVGMFDHVRELLAGFSPP